MKRIPVFALVGALLLIGSGACAQPDPADPQQEPATGANRAGLEGLLNPPKPGDVWWMREGKGYTLCEAMYQKFQEYTPDEVGTCPDVLALTLPGMSELDGWVPLVPGEHGDLWKSVTQHRNVGAAAYFGERPEYFEQRQYPLEILERGYQTFLGTVIAMRVNSRQLFTQSLGGDRLFSEPQAILEIRTPQIPEACPRITPTPEFVRTYYVSADLSGPDSRMRGSEAAALSASGGARFVEYKGVVHLMASYGSDILFWRDFGDGVFRSFCEIQQNRER